MYTKEIEKRIVGFVRGQLFCSYDFLDIANDDSIRKTLERLTKRGKIERIMRGIYLLPLYDVDHKVIKPLPYDVACEIARQNGWVVAPYGILAANYFNFTSEVTKDITLVSDGPDKRYQYEGAYLYFKHIHDKDMKGLSMFTIMTIQAIKAMKPSYFNHENMVEFSKQLSKENKLDLLSEIDCVTKWVAKIIKEVCEY